MIQFSMRVCNVSGPNIVKSNGIHQVDSNYFPARCGVALKDKVTAPSISSWYIYWKWSIPSGTTWFLNRWNREKDKMTYEQFGSVNVPDTRFINLICINFLLSGQFYLQNLRRLVLKNWKGIVIWGCKCGWPFRLMNFWRLFNCIT